MTSLTTILVFAGLIVLAIAIIVLVIWISVLSSRLKKLSDTVMEEQQAAKARMAQMQKGASEKREPARAKDSRKNRGFGMSAIGDSEDEASFKKVTGFDAAANAAARRQRGMKPKESQDNQKKADEAKQNAPAKKRSVNNKPVNKKPSTSVAQKPTIQLEIMESKPKRAKRKPKDKAAKVAHVPARAQALRQGNAPQGQDTDFFEGYAQANLEQRQQLKQRPQRKRNSKPQIPFGANKNQIEKRESYRNEAVSGDFELDSIDFTRVEGYKKLF